MRVGVDAGSRERTRHPVLALEPHLLARLDRATGGMSGCQRLCIREAPRRASPPSCSRGLVVRPAPRRAQMVQRHDRRQPAPGEDRGHDLGGEPAVGLEHRLEGGIVKGGAGVGLDDLAALRQLAHDRLGPQIHRALVPQRRRSGRERFVGDRERVVARQVRDAASRGWQRGRAAAPPGWRRSPSR